MIESLRIVLQEAFTHEERFVTSHTMFTYLRGVMAGYCLTNQLNLDGYETLYTDDIRKMCDSAKLPRRESDAHI